MVFTAKRTEKDMQRSQCLIMMFIIFVLSAFKFILCILLMGKVNAHPQCLTSFPNCFLNFEGSRTLSIRSLCPDK